MRALCSWRIYFVQCIESTFERFEERSSWQASGICIFEHGDHSYSCLHTQKCVCSTTDCLPTYAHLWLALDTRPASALRGIGRFAMPGAGGPVSCRMSFSWCCCVLSSLLIYFIGAFLPFQHIYFWKDYNTIKECKWLILEDIPDSSYC